MWLAKPTSYFSRVFYSAKAILRFHLHNYGGWETVNDATYEASGLKKHTCKVCGYEQTEEIPMLVKSSCWVIDGSGQNLAKSSGNTLVFTCNGEYEKFTGLKIDRALVDPSNYDKAKGSTIVTMKANYLETLSDGNHTIQFIYSDGASETASFTVKNVSAANKAEPQTGDNSHIFLWLTMAAVSCAALIGI